MKVGAMCSEHAICWMLQLLVLHVTSSRDCCFLKIHFILVFTSNNQSSGSAFDDLDPRPSLICDVIHPCKKSAGDARYVSQDPSTHGNPCPLQSWLQSVLGVHSSYVEHNKLQILLSIYLSSFLRCGWLVYWLDLTMSANSMCSIFVL